MAKVNMRGFDLEELKLSEDKSPEFDETESDDWSPDSSGGNFDNLIARYFGDVRQYSLLKRNQETALWGRIERAQKRERRALYMSPVALATLRRVCHEIEHDAVSLKFFLRDVEKDTALHVDICKQLGDAMIELQDIAARLRALRSCGQTAFLQTASSKRRATRRAYAELWQQWCKTWETFDLHPQVYDTLRQALEAEYASQPHNLALYAACRAWQYAHRRLNDLKVEMIRANLRLAIYIANRFRNRGVPFLDLIQEGNIGLMHALEKFEPSRGLKFITYAYWWVRQAVSRAVSEQYRTVRLPNHIDERRRKLLNVMGRLWGQYGRSPTSQELSVALGWTREEVEELQTMLQPVIRLQEPLAEDKGSLADILEDHQTPQPDALLADDQLRRCLSNCLASLSEREAFIVRLRYGLESEQPHTLQEVGDMLGLSRERVRQMEAQAFEKLRQPYRKAMLADFLLP
jgi:RNA polymerase primary sigma factor